MKEVFKCNCGGRITPVYIKNEGDVIEYLYKCTNCGKKYKTNHPIKYQ